MSCRTLWLSLCLCCVAFGLIAQELRVVSFEKTDRIDARTHPQRDNNGEKCALVKIASHIEGLNFDVGAYGITSLKYQGGEYWLYISPTEQRMEVWGDGYSKLKYRFPLSIESQVTYDMKLDLGPKPHKASDDVMELITRGIAKANLKDYRGAVYDFSRAIKLDDQEITAYRSRGMVRWKIKDYEGALADFTQVIELYPEDADAYKFRAGVKVALKDYEGAVDDYTETLTRNPQYAAAYKGRGFAHKQQQHYADARRDWQKAAELFQAEGDEERAEEVREDIDELPPPKKTDSTTKRIEAYIKEGASKYTSGDYRGAVWQYTKAIIFDSKYAPAYMGRGFSKKALGKKRSARRDWKKALKLYDKQGDYERSTQVQRWIEEL